MPIHGQKERTPLHGKHKEIRESKMRRVKPKQPHSPKKKNQNNLSKLKKDAITHPIKEDTGGGSQITSHKVSASTVEPKRCCQSCLNKHLPAQIFLNSNIKNNIVMSALVIKR